MAPGAPAVSLPNLPGFSVRKPVSGGNAALLTRFLPSFSGPTALE